MTQLNLASQEPVAALVVLIKDQVVEGLVVQTNEEDERTVMVLGPTVKHVFQVLKKRRRLTKLSQMWKKLKKKIPTVITIVAKSFV